MLRSHSLDLRAGRVTPKLFLSAALIALAGCGATPDIPSTEKAIKEGLAQQTGLAITSVTCPPESRPAKAGDTFSCTGKAEIGGSLDLTVTQKDDKGNFAWKVAKSHGLFNMEETEASVTQGLEKAGSSDVTVDCGDRWQAGEAGDTFECHAEAGGQSATVVVTVKDAEGNISWKVDSAGE